MILGFSPVFVAWDAVGDSDKGEGVGSDASTISMCEEEEFFESIDPPEMETMCVTLIKCVKKGTQLCPTTFV